MRISYIIVHHTLVSYKKNPDQWQATNEYHKKQYNLESSLGYYVGYNYEMSASGQIKQFRKDGEITAAQYQRDMNDGRAISICLDGNFDIEEPTDEQCKALHIFIKEKQKAYSIPDKNVIGHRYVANKSCPGKNITDPILQYLEKRMAHLSNWQKNALEWAISQEISNGERPLEPLTRVEAMELLRKFYERFILK